MTSQSKKYIELSDIMAFRFECSECHASISVPADDFQNLPRSCTNCHSQWEDLNNNYVKETFLDLARTINTAQSIVASRKLVVSVEIRDDVKPLASQTSAQVP